MAAAMSGPLRTVKLGSPKRPISPLAPSLCKAPSKLVASSQTAVALPPLLATWAKAEAHSQGRDGLMTTSVSYLPKDLSSS